MNSQPNNPWTKSTGPPIAPPFTSTLSPPRIAADHLHQNACLGGGHHDGLLPPPIPPDVAEGVNSFATTGNEPHRDDSSGHPPDITDGDSSTFTIEKDPRKDESSGLTPPPNPEADLSTPPTPQAGLSTPPTPQVDSCHDLR